MVETDIMLVSFSNVIVSVLSYNLVKTDHCYTYVSQNLIVRKIFCFLFTVSFLLTYIYLNQNIDNLNLEVLSFSS